MPINRCFRLLIVFAAAASVRAERTPAPCSSEYARQSEYDVVVIERDAVEDWAALISHTNGSSDFQFNFATAWFPAPSIGQPDGLVVRVVECNPDHHACPNASHPEWSNAGALAVVPAALTDSPLSTAHITTQFISWAGAQAPPRSNSSAWGAADPRIVYRWFECCVRMT